MKHKSLYESKITTNEIAAKGKAGLDGKTWTRYSISVWDDIQKTALEKKLNHPAMFPAQLAGRIIEIFSREGDLIIDPFMGTGSTIVAAIERNRKAVGFEIYSNFIEKAKARLSQYSHSLIAFDLYQDDANNIIKHVKPNSGVAASNGQKTTILLFLTSK